MQWPKKPFIYEINTAVWLTTLSRRYEEQITLANLPDEVLDQLIDLRVDTVWFMGIWQRSEAGRTSALNYIYEYEPVLPDITEVDVVGSAYAIGAYEVDPRLGGREGLAAVRQRLQERGIKVILDYVPNHVATDHAWVTEHPEYMVTADRTTYEANEDLFFIAREENDETDPLYVAHGRDPYFPSWIDTAQVNGFSEAYREAVVELLLDIASQCDGVRCDMAMLLVNRVFQQTWGDFVTESMPEDEFWEAVIPRIKAEYPNFIFMAEVYWNMEYELQQQGFDYTYDKVLFDRLHDHQHYRLYEHLEAEKDFQEKMVRFIENHDEPRAATTFGLAKSRAAATIAFTLPGPVLIHDGQINGRLGKLPVQINRQPDEPTNYALAAFYERLLNETSHPLYQDGEWTLLNIEQPYTETHTYHHIIASLWQHGEDLRLIVANLSPYWSQGNVVLPQLDRLSGGIRLFDALSKSYQYRDLAMVEDKGLYVELEPYQSQILSLQPISETEAEQFLDRTASRA